jgi:hypothetical protein
MQKYQPIHYNRLIDPSIVAASLRDDYRADPPTPAQGGTWVGGGNTVAPTLRDADAPLTGQTSFSMLFNGTTQYLDLLTADGSLPSVRRTGTIIAWFKGIPGANGVIYGTGNGTLFSGMWLTVNAAGTVAWNLRRGTGATDEVTLTSSATVNGNWHMLAVTCDNVNNNLMYVDGVSVAYGTTIAGVATAKDWWNDITIAGTYRPAVGARRTAAATFDLPYAGRVAECAITNRTLSAAEIADLYSKRNA